MVARALVPYMAALASTESTRAEVLTLMTMDCPVAQGRAKLHPSCLSFFPASSTGQKSGAVRLGDLVAFPSWVC